MTVCGRDDPVVRSVEESVDSGIGINGFSFVHNSVADGTISKQLIVIWAENLRWLQKLQIPVQRGVGPLLHFVVDLHMEIDFRGEEARLQLRPQ